VVPTGVMLFEKMNTTVNLKDVSFVMVTFVGKMMFAP